MKCSLFYACVQLKLSKSKSAGFSCFIFSLFLSDSFLNSFPARPRFLSSNHTFEVVLYRFLDFDREALSVAMFRNIKYLNMRYDINQE